MIGKHIDIIAIGFLLLAVAVFAHARRVIVIQPFGPPRVIVMPQDGGRVFLAPELPRLSFHRG
jgi:hypothetical protein